MVYLLLDALRYGWKRKDRIESYRVRGVRNEQELTPHNQHTARAESKKE